MSSRLYKEGDERGILELMKVCDIRRTVEEWIWEYRDNPFGQLIGIADYRGQVVGHMAWVPSRVKVGNRITMGSQAVDLVVHPKFRRHGIFLEIGRFLAEESEKRGNEVTYGFPNKPAHAGHLKYGWFNVCEVPIFIKPLNLTRALADDLYESRSFVRLLGSKKVFKKLVIPTLQSALMMLSLFTRILNRIGGYSGSKNFVIRTIESFDSRFDVFWNAVSRNHTIIVCRDRKFLNWRYFEKPKAKYTVFVAEENDDILGYIVLRTDSRRRLGWIVDILAYQNEKQAIDSLLSKAIEYFRKENADLAACLMLKGNSSANEYSKMLSGQGFVHLFGLSMPLIARANLPYTSEKYVKNPRNWYITMGDSDQI